MPPPRGSPPARGASPLKIEDHRAELHGPGPAYLRKAASIRPPPAATTCPAPAASKDFQGLPGGVGPGHRLGQGRIPRQIQGPAAQRLQIGQPPGGMGVPETLGDLQGLAEKGPHRDLQKSQVRGHLQGKAHVIPHLHKGLLGQFRQERLEVRLAFAPGAKDDVLQPHGLGHPQAGSDGGPVGLVGKGLHQPGGAQNRDAPHDPQAGVQGVAGQFLPPGHEDFHPQPQGLRRERPCSHTWPQAAADHPPGHRVDGRLAHRQGQTGFGHPADPFAAMEVRPPLAPAAVQPPDPGADLGAVGDVGVVAGVLDHRGLAPGPSAVMVMKRDGQTAAAGQATSTLRAGKPQQLPQGPLGRGRGRRAGGKALAQFLPGAGRPGEPRRPRGPDDFQTIFFNRGTEKFKVQQFKVIGWLLATAIRLKSAATKPAGETPALRPFHNLWVGPRPMNDCPEKFFRWHRLSSLCQDSRLVVHILERLCHRPIPAFHMLRVGQRPMNDRLEKSP